MEKRMVDFYPAHIEEVRRRHDLALEETGFDAVAIHAGSPHMIFLDDMAYPFKTNPHFKAWAPVLSNPHCWIVYVPGSRPRMIYWQPVDYWHLPASLPTDPWTAEFDLETIAEPQEAKTLMPSGRVAYIGEPELSLETWGFAATNPESLLTRLHFDRTWKTDYEIECIRLANRRAVRGHRAAEQAFRNGASEFAIHLAYLEATGHVEHELPYGNIIALNRHAAVLHYQHQDVSRPELVDSFLIDAGAVVGGYASDVTRTYSSAPGEFQDLISAVEAFQLELCDEIRPGLDYRELHFSAHRHVGRVLRESGLVNVDGDDAVELQITAAFFPHGLGHYLGLQVHDVAGFTSDRQGSVVAKPCGHPHLRLTRTVEPRQVFTVEPGIYFIDSLLEVLRSSDAGRHVSWSRVDNLRRFGGIRIEDDVVVTESGHENLTREEFARE